MKPDGDASILARVAWRILPLLMGGFFVAYLDRVNLSFAALQMNQDLGFTPAVYGLAAGLFFVPYVLLETPSNLLLNRVGARRWLARILFSWGLVSGATALVHGAGALYVLRALLGAAEAGFLPGVIFVLTLWFPTAWRGRMMGWFMAAAPISFVVGAPLSGLLLRVDGALGLRGWQWLFVVEALPALLLAAAVWRWLPDGPETAAWLRPGERERLAARLAAERGAIASPPVWRALADRRVLLLGVAGMGATFSTYGVSFFLPLVVQGFGVSTAMNGVITAVPFLAGALAMVGFGRWSDGAAARGGERRHHAAAALLLAALGLAAAGLAAAPALKMAGFTVALAGTFAMLGPYWAIPGGFLQGAAAAGGIAMMNSIANLSGFLGPTLIGRMGEAGGNFDRGFMLAAATAVIAAAAALASRR